MKIAIFIGAVILGIVLLGLSTIWTSLVRAESTWTEEKSQRSVEVKARLAYLGDQINPPKASKHRGSELATLKAEFDALKKENEQLNADFLSVSDRPNAISKYLKWAGVALTVVGLIGWYAVKQSS
jgi:hypothetical protein